MTTTLNAVSGTGLVQTSDGSGVVKLQSNGVATNALAWANFNGTTTVSIRASYNISSITRNGSGDYTLNFTSAMTDANYAFMGSGGGGTSSLFATVTIDGTTPRTTSLIRFVTTYLNGTASTDNPYVNVAIFGN